MSKWSHLEGDIIIHKSKNCSVAKVAALIFDDYTINLERNYDGDCYSYRVMISFEEDGKRAWNDADKFKTHLEDEYNALCNFTLEVSL